MVSLFLVCWLGIIFLMLVTFLAVIMSILFQHLLEASDVLTIAHNLQKCELEPWAKARTVACHPLEGVKSTQLYLPKKAAQERKGFQSCILPNFYKEPA
ncbi:hypothetical protein DUNSADRAFT_14277 [Dunaliella salina]|uniref:Uncharacterized protein n=1 Tax=Dunaliella salina TaxID=3046 RepID=A0ABQ7H2L9_DUNSA|nr:hypothetical protein DUNSADRAFT_14277 [Dunaliella salina]|eukprot:KAF5841102.1 hypothetical protein DUNSADRAFT_14277 [Dunaliella salina]